VDKKIKILFVLNILNPGTGPFQRGIRLNEEICDVTILSFYDTQEELEQKVEKSVNFKHNKKLIGLGLRRRFDIIKLIKFLKILKQNKFDIIQSNHTFSGLISLWFSKIINPSSVCIHFEGTMRTRFSIINRFFRSLGFCLLDGDICVSKAVYNSFSLWEKLIMKKVKKTVIYNGIDLIDLEKFKGQVPKKYLKLKEKYFIIGYVGDLKEVKGIPTLLTAFSILVHEYQFDDCFLILVGDGSLRQQLEEIAKSLNIFDRIIFTGLLERFEVYEILNVFDAFVLPSKFEGLSEALVQAMGAGVPVIVSDILPNLEIVSDGYNGLVFPVGDAYALAERIFRLYKNSTLRKQLIINAQDKIKKEFSIYSIVRKYLQFYRDLINSNRGGKNAEKSYGVRP